MCVHKNYEKICAHGNANGNVIVFSHKYVEMTTKFERVQKPNECERARVHAHTYTILKTKIILIIIIVTRTW